MAQIEGIRISNYKTLKNITIGKLWNTQNTKPLTTLTAVIGQNGVGKSSLFDAFGFLSDCLKMGVEEACDSSGRGGFEKIISKGSKGPIEFEIYYKENRNDRPITYELAINVDKYGRPYVQSERLRQRRKGQSHGKPFSFLILYEGRGVAWVGKDKLSSDEDENIRAFKDFKSKYQNNIEIESNTVEIVELDDYRKLGISTLGSLKQHTRISSFRQFMENWYLSYFTPDAARSLPLAGPQKHLNMHGDNLGNVVQYMEREHKEKFDRILKKIAKKIPGITNINTEKTVDGRLLLRFFSNGFKEPFYAQQMSDGTLKIFAYLLMLEDPSPAPFLCIEEPENGLYHKLLGVLASEFREHADNSKIGTQVFITTHQPSFVDALNPNEVWILSKGKDGFSTIKRASDIVIIQNLVSEGISLGDLWYSDYLDVR